jgi:biotin carboxylase
VLVTNTTHAQQGKHLLVIMLNGSSVIRLDEHIDHDQTTVTYVTDRARAANIARYRELVADVAVVDNPTDVDGEVTAAVRHLCSRFGTAQAVFTPSEYDLLTAAQIRDRFGISGMTAAHTLTFRDKVLMKQRVRAAGLAVPRFAACDRDGEPVPLAELVAATGYPLVLKPRRGMGSRGIHVVHDDAELERAHALVDPAEYEAEEFVTGTIYHVDGLVYQGELAFARVSRYLTTCLETAHDRVPLGSVIIDEEPLRGRLLEFARSCAAAQELDRSAFHLEIILRDEREPVFLEVGARPGGGQIRFMFDDLYQVDLMRQWANMQLGQPPNVPATDGPIGGWVTVPPPCPPPYQIVAVTPMSERVPNLYYERLPRPGDVYDADRLRQDRWAGGRFRFRGASTVEVEAAIVEVMNQYRLDVRGVAGDHVAG